MDKRDTDNKYFLTLLLRGNKITTLKAFRLRECTRLGARIYDLRHGVYDGIKWPIKGVRAEHTNKSFVIYEMDLTKSKEITG